MVRPRKVPNKNEDGAPCKVCGATENTLWYCAYDAEQNRLWLSPQSEADRDGRSAWGCAAAEDEARVLFL